MVMVAGTRNVPLSGRKLSARSVLLWIAVAFGLAACGGGGVGGEQKPDPVVVDVPIAYVKHGSGLAPFDACALKHAKRMRFAPGRDDFGRALDVWIHLRIEPLVRPERLVAGPRRGRGAASKADQAP